MAEEPVQVACARAIDRTRQFAPGERVSRRIAGMDLVHWITSTHGFLLVGSAPMVKLARLADVVKSRLSG